VRAALAMTMSVIWGVSCGISGQLPAYVGRAGRS